MVNLHCCLHLMSAHGSATADASVMAPSPFAVKLSVGAVGAVGGGGALSQEVLSRRRSCLSPLVGGGAAACSPTVSQEEEEVVWAGRGACPPLLSRAGEGQSPRNREWARDIGLFARYPGLELLELTDQVAEAELAAMVRALARPSKTTPRPWVYEAGARAGLEI